MHRTTDDERRRGDLADPRRGHGISAQMYAVGSNSQRDIEPIIDEHARARPFDGVHCRRDQLCQCPCFEVGLPDLHQVDARPCRRTNLLDERTIALRRRRLGWSHHTDHWEHGRFKSQVTSHRSQGTSHKITRRNVTRSITCDLSLVPCALCLARLSGHRSRSPSSVNRAGEIEAGRSPDRVSTSDTSSVDVQPRLSGERPT